MKHRNHLFTENEPYNPFQTPSYSTFHISLHDLSDPFVKILYSRLRRLVQIVQSIRTVIGPTHLRQSSSDGTGPMKVFSRGRLGRYEIGPTFDVLRGQVRERFSGWECSTECKTSEKYNIYNGLSMFQVTLLTKGGRPIIPWTSN